MPITMLIIAFGVRLAIGGFFQVFCGPASIKKVESVGHVGENDHNILWFMGLPQWVKQARLGGTERSRSKHAGRINKNGAFI